jgi:hypothetical protein
LRQRQAIKKRGDRVKFTAEQPAATAHAGAMQIITNLLRNAAYLFQHYRFGVADAQLFTA